MKHQRTGIALIVLAATMFATLDAATKLSGALAPVMMLLWFRYAFQAVATFALRLPVQGLQLFATRNPRFQLLRGVLLLTTSACSFFGLQYLPVGRIHGHRDVVTAGRDRSCGLGAQRKVSAPRWTLLALGLSGALMVIRPGGQLFGWALLFPVLLVGTYASFQVLTSRLSGDENPYTTHLYTGLVGTVVMSAIVPLYWSTTALLSHWPWFVAIGFLGTFGHLLLIKAFGKAPSSVLTPYLYSQIGFATLLGWLAFRHTPDTWAWSGIAVIAVCGMACVWLTGEESRLARVIVSAEN
ncbi:DMT family transporter [Polaromonas sp. P1-6]|nr:DMT family transporter [Polaromonas sp. P1-6]